jgi:RNA polymerase sigma-70 factor, ECF subfamily
VIPWSELVEEHGPAVYGVALRIVGQSADAEDVIQEVFLEVHRLWKSRRVVNWRPLLRRLTVRRSLDNLRRRRGELCLPEQAVAHGGQNPHDAACTAELQDYLRIAISRLPSQQAEVLSLHFFEGMSHEEIASDLQITRQGVASALHKARTCLARNLERVFCQNE